MMKKVVLFTLIWLIIVNIFAVVSLNRFNLAPDTAYPWIFPEDFHQQQSWDPLSLREHWDGVWYTRIAKEGYSYQEGKASSVVFFPLYPFLIYLGGILTLGNLALSGWILSTVFLFLATIYLYKLVSEFHKGIDPILAVIFMLTFPTAFFLNAIYTESLFLFLSIACFYYTFKKNFLLASLFGILASLTRVTGFLLIVPLLIEYFRIYGQRGISSFKILPLLAIPLGTVSYFLSHYLVFGDFFLFLRAQAWFGRSFKLNQDHFTLFGNPSVVHFALDTSFVALAAISILFMAKKLRFSYAVYTLLLIAIPISTGTLMSIGRYVMVAFPIYILFASIKNEYLRLAILLASTLLLAMNITQFVSNYWAG